MQLVSIKTFKKLLIANRGEIAIRIMRAATELGIRTVSIYTFEDRYSLHRFKSDESYMIGDEEDPLRPYLDHQAIIDLALAQGVDAIHPGYGFLSENVDFAKACLDNNIAFIGPKPEVMAQLGDKVAAKQLARKLNIPLIEGTDAPLSSIKEASKVSQKTGFPLILKAAAGGGGRGMRVVHQESELATAFQEAKFEAKRAFGNDAIFIEQFITSPRHIEVQILGDQHGNVLHLFERDCSVQRRFQKVVEFAPSIGLSDETKNTLYQHALSLAKAVGYENAGTVEFLLDDKNKPYFIEVNPRIQVEHTVTEEITGIDLVQSQLLIAMGHDLHGPKIGIPKQEELSYKGTAIQCRITTENPQNDFKPDYGRLISYRSPGGFGIRLDAGNAYDGVHISPFFDSLLVKITATGMTRAETITKLDRALKEFRIRGLNTNIPFVRNVINHPKFRKGEVTVNFIQNHPELFKFAPSQNTATKALKFLANHIVNGNPELPFTDDSPVFKKAIVPKPSAKTAKDGSKQKLDALGPVKFAEWLKKQKAIQFTDTTMRDAHQSLLATRVRTRDLLAVAETYAKDAPNLFSMEVWGGATFDVSMRFLKECPWDRLQLLRAAIPNVLLQMLLRGSNGVGYTAYPDNVIDTFIQTSAEKGIDVFRIFDSQNDLRNMAKSVKTVIKKTDRLAEVCLCYTGDISNPEKTKFTLDYYLDLAKRIEDMGAHILAIKDMAGLLKPYAAKTLISALKSEISLPIHLHTHDTSSVQAASLLQAIDAGVDVVDVALASMSGLTSQPNFNSLVAALQRHPRENAVDLEALNAHSRYWDTVRAKYFPFESGLKAGTAEVYDHEIPGGQYSNLQPQARALGLDNKIDQITQNYKAANDLLGGVVKVTPSSKVVGDLALFMTSNNLSKEMVLEQAETLDFPASLIGFLNGDLGKPHGGFPKAFQKQVLKANPPKKKLTPPDVDHDAEYARFKKRFPEKSAFHDYLSWQLYPVVFEAFYAHLDTYGATWSMPTEAFFYKLKPRQELVYDIGEGKTITIMYMHTEAPLPNGHRPVFFKLNGQTRVIEVLDQQAQASLIKNKKVSSDNEIGAPLQGKLSKIFVKPGDKVAVNDPLFVIEAMKMETTVTASQAGKVHQLLLHEKDMVEQDDAVLSLKS